MAMIQYLGHSGFAVRTSANLLIFDYLGKGLPTPKRTDRAIAFVSHGHADHDQPCVHDWAEMGLIQLAVGEDVRTGGVRFSPGDGQVLEGAIVRAFGSTDQGVSFWVESGGLKVFHAGDYNLWHWKDEHDANWTRRAEHDFSEILETLRGVSVDVAFFPVDPRMKTDCAAGALRFAEAVSPKLLIPMHFWDKPRTAIEFARQPMPSGVRAVALITPGEQLTYEEAIK
ncbi:MAG: MBL fold metallo-hydrolase [Clostridia bacterium]